MLVAILAVGREGLETALFLWSATEAVSRDTNSTWQPLVGAALGIATAVVLAYLLYRGAVSINLSTFFTWTGGFLILVAGGVLSYGVHDLQEAGVLPGLDNLAWDVSDTIDPTTWYATLLKGIFNFSPATTVLEATVWVLYVVPVMFLFIRGARRRTSPPAPAPSATDPYEGTDTPMRKPLLVAALLVTTPFLAACTENAKDSGGDSGDTRTVSVTSTDDECKVSTAEVPSGTVTFDVTNEGSQVTEFYLLGEDGLRIVAEVENVGPQLSRQLVVDAPAGTYFTACKPGMKGDGIRADFTVATSGDEPSVSADDQELVDTALTNYSAYVQDQSDQLVTKTQEFVDLYKSGDDDAARALYPEARTHWERIETVAESFGDLDPLTDAREADLEPGEKWTGWHRIEKDLWPELAENYTQLTTKQRAFYADDLMKNITTLDTRVQGLDYTVDQIANGSRGLLEEVAAGKVTGEEEYWSHTDLWDFQANVDGARVGFEGVKPIVEQSNPELAKTLTTRFAELQTLLDAQKTDTGFTFYDDLTPDQVQDLANAVNALSEPLSQLTAAVLS